MRRREFMALIGGFSFAWPFAAWAQQLRKQSRIAFVHSGIRGGSHLTGAGNCFNSPGAGFRWLSARGFGLSQFTPRVC